MPPIPDEGHALAEWIIQNGVYTAGVIREVEDLFQRQAAWVCAVAEPGVNVIRSFAYSAPLEDLRLKRP